MMVGWPGDTKRVNSKDGVVWKGGFPSPMLSWKRSIDAAVARGWRRCCCMAKTWSKGGLGWRRQGQCPPSCTSPPAEAGQGLTLKVELVPNSFMCRRSPCVREDLHVSEAPLMHNLLENFPRVPKGKQPTHEQVWMSRPLFQHHNEGQTRSGWGPLPWKSTPA